MKQKRIEHFQNPERFFQLEEQAIDGQLDYSDYPPEEYRYFSKLTKLGYCNRHKGWTKETCEQLQEEYRKEYRESCTERGERVQHMKRLQGKLIRSNELSRQLNLARSREEALDIALDLIENLLNEPGMARRIRRNMEDNNDA